MDGLTPEQWTAIGPLLDNYALRLDAIVNGGIYVDTTAKGFLFHLMTDIGIELAAHERARQEDEAWNEHHRRMADEASENDYDEYMSETQDGQYPQGWRDAHMI